MFGWLGGCVALLLWLCITDSVLVRGAEVDTEVTRVRQLRGGVEAEEIIRRPLCGPLHIEDAAPGPQPPTGTGRCEVPWCHSPVRSRSKDTPMRLRFLFVVGIITGYILGARAGRARYVQLKAKATETWEDPRVQKAVADTQEFVKENAPIVAEKVAEGAKVAGEKVAEGAKVAGEKVSEGAKVAAENIGAATEKVVDSARIASTTVAEGAKVAMDSAKEAAEKLVETAKDAAEKMSATAKSTAKTVTEKVTGASDEPATDEPEPTNDARGVGAPHQ